MAWNVQRIDIDPLEIYRTIEKYGYTVVWEKAMKCPCIEIGKHGQPDFNCKVCMGKGWYWYDPKMIKGILSAISGRESWERAPGEILSGTAYFTTHAVYRINFWDRITNYHSLIRHSCIVERGIGKVDNLRFKPVKIYNVFDLDKEYKNGIDFIVNDDKKIEWIEGGESPKIGSKYSIDYELHPSWIVIDMVNLVRDAMVKQKRPGVQFTRLPQRAMVRLEYFVFA